MSINPYSSIKDENTYLSDGSIEIIAGDDFTFNVNFSMDGNEVVFTDGDRVEMLIHGYTEDIVPATKIEGNIATFYLNSELTTSLLIENRMSCSYRYCIRVIWGTGGQHTPIHRKTLIIKRC